ncbi:MAG TPA: restriction endonuclease subunit S, partial [Anaerovoracaceae bacterium]|nr:restriction endonuclease subunit S [Anaerovoracaceae bacterium]
DKLDYLVSRVDVCRTHMDRVPGIIKRFRQAILFMATNGQLTKDWRIKIGLENEEHQDSTKRFDFPDTNCFGTYEFPVSWAIHRLGEIADITGGITKDSKKQNPNDEEIPYLRVANVQRGFLDLAEVKTIRVPADRLNELKLQPGDILFTEGGDLDKLGRGWIWSGEIETCVFQNHVFRARLKDERYSPKFFSFYGNSRGYDYFLTYGKQTTNLASINKSLLEALPVVVPHPDEQHEIVRRIEVLFAHADQLEARYRSAKELIESLPGVILGKAFRGELVPQDLNDEPAAVLLERIKMERAKQAQLPKPDRKVTKPRETKMTEAELKEIIRNLPIDTFSFDDLRERIPGDYEQIKRLLFSVLSETDAIIKQVFDPNAEAIRFIRRER